VTPQRLEHFRAMERDARRPLGGSVLHPDACPKLVIRGVAWAVPPRGIAVSPSFTEEGVFDQVQVGDDPFPEAGRLMQLAEIKPQGEPCPSCGRMLAASLSIDMEKRDFLTALFGLAAKLLRSQYDLKPGQLSELLSFGGDAPPAWINQLFAWCAGREVV
jgi:hypothetical protein